MSDINMKGLFGIMDRLNLTRGKSFDAVLTKDAETLNNKQERKVL